MGSPQLYSAYSGRGGDSALAAELAIEGTALWALGQHDAALQTLQRMEGLLLNDSKVQLNMWLAGYYADPSVSLDGLSEQLAAWLDSHKQQQSKPSSPAYTAAAINYGIVLFVQQQHAKALAVLEPLHSHVEAMHGGAALCLCVLLLEIYLGSGQLPKAAQVLHYLQSSSSPGMAVRAPFSGDAGDDASSSHAHDAEHGQQLQQQLQTSPKHSPRQQQQPLMSPKHPLLVQQPSPQQSPRTAQGLDQQPLPQQQQQQGEQQPELPVCLDLPLVTRCTSAFMQQVSQLVEQQGGQLSGMDVPALLHLYKARLAIACCNLKAARKELRALLALQPSSPAAVLLKSQLELLRQQPKKALKALGPLLAAASGNTPRCRLQLLNVLAAIHQQLGKHHVAALYLTAALAQQQADSCKQQGLPNRTNSSSQIIPNQQQSGTDVQPQGSGKQPQGAGKQQGSTANAARAKAQLSAPEQQQEEALEPRCSRWLLPDDSNALQYNLGLQQLALHNWQGAIECFEAASCSLYMQPQLWLRLAEATLSSYHELHEQRQQQPVQQQLQQELQQHPAQQQPEQQQHRPVPTVKGQQQQQRNKTGSSEAAAQPGAVLLQQAAEQLSTGLELLRQQQAEAAKQTEETAAAMTAAAAAEAAAAAGLSLAEQHGAAWLGTASHSSLYEQVNAAGGSSELAGYCNSVPNVRASASAGGAPSVAAASPVSTDAAAAAAAASSVTALDACMLPPGTPAVQQALLANQAYVYLLLQQPLPALESAKALLACSGMSPQQHYLGSCYAAEALCLLGHTEDAAEQLQGHMALYMSTSNPAAATAAAPADHGSSSIAAEGTCNAAAAAAMTGCALVPASSVMSDDDGSCAGCKSNGPCSVLAPGHSSGGSSSMQQRERQAAVLRNMSSVLALQGGDLQESRRYAALAAAQDPACSAVQLL